jgi:hypothetical protein
MPQLLFSLTFPLENDEFEKYCVDVEKSGSHPAEFKKRLLVVNHKKWEHQTHLTIRLQRKTKKVCPDKQRCLHTATKYDTVKKTSHSS